jgi:hypothetical protein
VVVLVVVWVWFVEEQVGDGAYKEKWCWFKPSPRDARDRQLRLAWHARFQASSTKSYQAEYLECPLPAYYNANE